ncbi:unnamed protein product [Calypogeia fissa]
MTQTRAQAALEELERARGVVQVEVLTSVDLGGAPRSTPEARPKGVEDDLPLASKGSYKGLRGPFHRARYPMGDREAEPAYEPLINHTSGFVYQRHSPSRVVKC